MRSEGGLRVIDLEAAGVNYAIQDIAYCFGTTCHTDEHKEAFVRTYLAACGLPTTDDDVFDLRLDAERCRMATNHFDTNGVVQLPSSAQDAAGVGPLYPDLVAIADRSLENEELAHDIVQNGFAGCELVVTMVQEHGIPVPGTPVGILTDPAASWRTDLTVNWDGTIQPGWQRHRALVLGLVDGRVALTNCLDPDRLRLRMIPGGIPVTGVREPRAAPLPLHLAGRNAGRSLVRSQRHEAWWNPVDTVRIGPLEDSLSVHIEPDGVIRVADTPTQAFDCASGHTSPGTRLHLFHNFCGDRQRFSCHDDGTISPIANSDVVWGIIWNHVNSIASFSSSSRTTTSTDPTDPSTRNRRGRPTPKTRPNRPSRSCETHDAMASSTNTEQRPDLRRQEFGHPHDRLRQGGLPTPTHDAFAGWFHMSPDPAFASRINSMPIHPNQGICVRPNTDWKTLSCGSTVRIPAIAMKYPRKMSVVGSLPDR